MSSQQFSSPASSAGQVSRRTFVKGLAVGVAAAGLGLWRAPALAQGNPPVAWTTLSGTEFDLGIGETPMNFTGSPRVAFTVNGSVPNDMYDVPPWRISTKGNILSIAPLLSSFDVRPTMRLFDIVLPITVFHSPMPDLMFSRSV